jgi:hypothetical protein
MQLLGFYSTPTILLRMFSYCSFVKHLYVWLRSREIPKEYPWLVRDLSQIV